jgi:hypothetical protein
MNWFPMILFPNSAGMKGTLSENARLSAVAVKDSVTGALRGAAGGCCKRAACAKVKESREQRRHEKRIARSGGQRRLVSLGTPSEESCPSCRILSEAADASFLLSNAICCCMVQLFRTPPLLWRCAAVLLDAPETNEREAPRNKGTPALATLQQQPRRRMK